MTSSAPVRLRLQLTSDPLARGTWKPAEGGAWWACPDCAAVGWLGTGTFIDCNGYAMPACECPDVALGRCSFADYLRLESWTAPLYQSEAAL